MTTPVDPVEGGKDRLHDRLRFVRDDAEGGGWIVQRLAP